jgi:histone H3/H4
MSSYRPRPGNFTASGGSEKFIGADMAEKETLVIASKVKAYIKEAGDMKCSATVIDALSDKVRALCDEAVRNAKADKRKTVQDKDVR